MPSVQGRRQGARNDPREAACAEDDRGARCAAHRAAAGAAGVRMAEILGRSRCSESKSEPLLFNLHITNPFDPTDPLTLLWEM